VKNYSEKEIVERLINGEDSNDIANEMVNMLNAAVKKYKDEQAEKLAQQKREKEKLESMTKILDSLENFCLNYYCKTEKDKVDCTKAFANIEASDVIELIESLNELGKLSINDYVIPNFKTAKPATDNLKTLFGF
jgi:hypothetical protein